LPKTMCKIIINKWKVAKSRGAGPRYIDRIDRGRRRSDTNHR